jgi:hypothetical protein
MRRVLIYLVVLWVLTIVLYVVWQGGPDPAEGWWFVAGIAAMVTGTMGLALSLWQMVQVKRRTGSYWPQIRR